jgi:hypothetical protein
LRGGWEKDLEMKPCHLAEIEGLQKRFPPERSIPEYMEQLVFHFMPLFPFIPPPGPSIPFGNDPIRWPSK